jgi:hypothetical protein
MLHRGAKDRRVNLTTLFEMRKEKVGSRNNARGGAGT